MSTTPETKPRGIVRGIITPGAVRIAFPHLKAPHSGGKFPSNKYEVHALIPKADTATLTLLRAKCVEAVCQVLPGTDPAHIVIGVRDGDEKANLDGFPGAYFIHPKSARPVPVFDGQRQPVEAGQVKGGDYARLMVSAAFYRKNLDPGIAKDLAAAGRKVWTEKGADGKVSYYLPGATFYLDAVQWLRTGEAFGGGTVDPGAFPEEGPVDFG